MLTKSLEKKSVFPDNIKLYDKILMGTAFLFAFFFMSHPDLWETANHSYVFLESIFSGNFFNFYEYIAAHNNTYYYINVANYNVIIYIIFGLWELPVYIFNQIFHLALNEQFIIYWAKIVSAGFFVGCGFMLKRLCEALGFEKSKASTAALFFLFNPIAFYSPMVMGQYDTLCLFFTLWALCRYVKGDYGKFSFILGIGIVCKFFPLMIFIPLILLAEKRILKLLQYALTALWLYIPTTLLFMGKTGNAKAFTQAMIDRMFAVTTETGVRGVSVFTLAYALIVFAAFVYVPKSEKARQYMSVYVPMAVFGVLFNYICWHPQWLILFIPFVTLTTFMQKNKAPWFYLDIVLCLGFFLHCFYQFPNQVGAVLFDGGLFSHLTGLRVATSENWVVVSHFLSLISYVYVLTPVMFTGAIFANIILKFPVGNMSLSDRLSDSEKYDKIPTKLFAYGIFLIGFVGIWLLPSLLEALNAFGVI